MLSCAPAQSLQSCLILCSPVDSSPLGFSVHGIFQARILEWVAMASSWGSSWPRNITHIFCISCIAGGFLTHWTTWDQPSHPQHQWGDSSWSQLTLICSVHVFYGNFPWLLCSSFMTTFSKCIVSTKGMKTLGLMIIILSIYCSVLTRNRWHI